MLSLIVKAVLVVLVLAVAANQASMYYNIVVAGPYMSVAPIHLQIITGGLWPVLVILIGWLVIKTIVKFPADLS